jgi:hypothetical protein
MVVLVPEQIFDEPAVSVTVGVGFIVMVILSLPLHPLASVPTIVYVVVVPGLALTTVPVVAFNPVAGLQVYETPPDAVSFAESTEHIATELALTLITGLGFTVTLTLAVSGHPAALVPTTT